MRQTPIELYQSQRVLEPKEQAAAKLVQRAQEFGTVKPICGFDVDGVITTGINPGPNDVIITGRSYHMAGETFKILHSRNIFNPVYFNPEHRSTCTRQISGEWKAQVINSFKGTIYRFFEDDPIQWEIIESRCPDVEVVYIMSNLVEK